MAKKTTTPKAPRYTAREQSMFASRAFRARLNAAGTVTTPSGFNYTTPTVYIGEHGKELTDAERKARCMGKERKSRQTLYTGRTKQGVPDKRCSQHSKALPTTEKKALCQSEKQLVDVVRYNGTDKNGRYDPACKAVNENVPHTSGRKGCPVNFVFRDGQPMLSFRLKTGKQGKLIPVSSPKAAVALGKDACAYWNVHKNFDGYDFPALRGLGRTSRRKKKTRAKPRKRS